jgi:hypothetical protein
MVADVNDDKLECLSNRPTQDITAQVLKGAMSAQGQFRRFARVPNWSGVPQQPEAMSALGHFGVAPGAHLPTCVYQGLIPR